MSKSGSTGPKQESAAKRKKPNIASRLAVIDQGLDYLDGIGSNHICRVCIAHGGSCCRGCRHLLDGVGCTRRNTSCTAWLCGFLRYVLYETDQLGEWKRFWKQIPGLDYREDYTPDLVKLRYELASPQVKSLGESLAADLSELAGSLPRPELIIDLREQIDFHLDQLSIWRSPGKREAARQQIRQLSKPFRRFHLALEQYRTGE